ncbi:hypothetical protein AXF42_Ash010858 [Apostasia shenzhenica]|uniref:Uncharacterized protein n=1 Tax=Apostasia shenzhenica TaxID=1088818 RepID=A0A2I0A0U6_9ASPA|nr:hypothetical protein AXF42_Ash010858 [Apostasia shenzhenica]
MPSTSSIKGSSASLQLLFFAEKFLEEARKHERTTINLQPVPPSSPSLPAKATAVKEDRKSRKSWKRTLFFRWWRRPEKRSSVREEDRGRNVNGCEKKKKNGPVSGPLFSGRGGAGLLSRRPASGPLAGMSAPETAEEIKLPYTCLYGGNHKAFGPVYLVT